jgi:N-acetylmuramoyl-L-alanine amidase
MSTSGGSSTLRSKQKPASRSMPRNSALAWSLIAFCAVAPALARAGSRSSAKREHAAKAYENALKLRTALEARRPQSRSYKDYLKVVRAFDLVYRTDPGYSKTPSALASEAALYQEMGHVLNNSRYFESAIAAYQFLSDQYGGAPVARESLLTVGDIYRVDLRNDKEAAQAYSDYLTRFPYSDNAAEARQRLKEMGRYGSSQPGETVTAVESERSAAAASNPAGRDHALQGGHLLAVSDVRYWEGANYVRIVICVEDEAKFEAARLSHPDRIVFDLPGTHLTEALKGKSFPIGNGFLRDVRVAQFKPDVSRVVLDVAKIDDYSVFTLPNPFRLIIDVRGTAQPLLARSADRPAARLNSRPTSPAVAAQPPDMAGPVASGRSMAPGATASTRETTALQPAERIAGEEDADTGMRSAGNVIEGQFQPSPQTSSGSNTLTRALGLKIARIVIDPGHGGHDTGTIGPDGVEEKNVVLDVGLRLRRLIQQHMGSDVIMTRSDDTFIPLEERTAIANQRGADLFISIHANASRDPSARGIEVYYLNFTSDPNSLETAARENATSQESVYQLQSLIKKIALTEKIQESSEFARQVDESLQAATARTGNEQPNRGLKKAPFVVLIGANMPSILAEISFLTNPRDEHLLSESNYREQIAEGLYRGVARYVATLGSMRIAQRGSGGPPSSIASHARALSSPPSSATANGATDY